MGADGANGADGPQGPQGDKGDQGDPGPMGLPGDGTAPDAGYLEEETDPLFAAAPAAGITAAQITDWNAAFGFGDHAAAGYLKTETDPLFSASAAAGVTLAQIVNWDAAFGFGNHATAGYLKTETDPLFSASVAAGITAGKVSNWDTASAWGNHATAGYLLEEEDPSIGNLSNGRLPKWNGTSSTLVDSVLSEDAGKIGISNATPDATLSVGRYASLGKVSTGTSKTCPMASGNVWTNTPPSAGACTAYCATNGFNTGVVSATGSRSCGAPTCSYISDFNTCTTATQPNNGNCDTCAQDFVCTCSNSTSQFQSEVQLDSYVRLAGTTGAPPSTECSHANHRGRMKVDPASGSLYICANSGWISK